MAEVEQSGAGAKALVLVSQARTKFVALPARRRSMLMASVAALVAVVLGMTWYAGRPDWRVLFSGLESRDVQQVSQELAAAGIAYQATPDGAGVEVPADLLDKARMEVAAKGMPQTGRLGFELFDKPNWVGSEFDERVNYQRALEGELEHTIATLGVVRSARVHLVLPQATLFGAEQKVAKASVVLKLKHPSLDPEQTESIRNLVAGAVENLNPDQVTLVDADGRANLQGKGHSALEADVETAMEAKLIAMLEPLAGPGNVRATVKVGFEEGTEERTDEIYDPAQTAVLSRQKSEQTSGSAKTAQGVPGTASNTPAAAPVGAVQGSAQAAAPGVPPLLEKSVLPVYPQSGGQTQTRTEETGTYAVTKHLLHSEQGPGRVRRITAAVVVNDREFTEGAGQATHAIWKPRTGEEMHRLESLAQAAVGFDEKRGDQVVMENVSFTSNVPEPKSPATMQIVEQARNALRGEQGLVKTAMFGLLGLVLIWFVLRPVAGQIVTTLQDPALLTAGQAVETRAVFASEAAQKLPAGEQSSIWQEPVAAAEPMRRRTPPNVGAAMYQQVSEHIRREPAQSTRLLEAWIGAEGEGE